MPILTSLLDAIVRDDGDALVLCPGDHPYIVTPSGRVELSSRVLTLEAITNMLGELLPQAVRQSLDEIGAVQYDLVVPEPFAREKFVAVAARGGGDIWVEIRRHRQPAATDMMEPQPEPPPDTAPQVEATEPEPQRAVVSPPPQPQEDAERTLWSSQPPQPAGIERLLLEAAASGASTLYLTSHARPSSRIDGKFSTLEGEAVLSESDIDDLILELIPERDRDPRHIQSGAEWTCDVPGVGRVRCTTFRDHRGAGGIFRMMPARAISAEHLGLSRTVQHLCDEAEGLVLIAGPRSSGRTTLLTAFVDLINRTRSEHVITLENEIQFVHEPHGSRVSQREVRGNLDDLESAVRTALREHPDVLVIEDFAFPEIVTLALEAAQSGCLVIGALTAHTAADAAARLIDQAPPESRPRVQAGLAAYLRGIVVQVLVRRIGGGRVAAREVLLNTSAVADIIAEGRIAQLSKVFEGGCTYGMVALDAALAALVRGGEVDARDAYCLAADQPEFLDRLRRQGLDTSFADKLEREQRAT